jgi:hypothetical protein
MTDALKPTVRRIVQLLVAGEYGQLEALTGGVRLAAAEIAGGVAEYPGRLIEPPEEAYDLMGAVRVIVAKDETWFVTMPLWTAQEGRSDLEVQLTVAFGGGGVAIELHNILVP